MSKLHKFHQFYHTNDETVVQNLLSMEVSVREKDERIKNQDTFIMSLGDKLPFKFGSV